MKTTNTYLTVRGLRVFARHGVLAQEKTVGNEFEVSARLYYDATAAIDNDSVDYAIDYAEVIRIITAEMQLPSRLLEYVTGRIARSLLSRFPLLEHGTVTVTKIHPPVSASFAGASFSLDFAR